MKLSNNNNEYHINNKKVFKNIPIEKQFIDNSYDFAYSMVFEDGYHRKHRSGGQHNRKNGELFANTFQGKLAEFMVHNELKKEGLTELSDLDTSIYGKGIWDDTDLEYKGKKINIKSAAFFSNLLLLETKDWNNKGEYIPNLNSASSQSYDYFLMVRIKPDIKQLFQREKIFYSNDINKNTLTEIIYKQDWFFDFAGICSDKTIKHIIKNKYLLPQNSLLNGKIKMDAENYYIQSGNLKEFDFFVNELRKL